MKKSFLTILLSLILCFSLFSFGGCEIDEPDEYGFFSQKKLDAFSIPNLPKIKKSKDETKLEYGTFRYNTTKSEYDQYVNSVFDYLTSCKFTYFGTAKTELDSFFGGAPKYSFERGVELNDFNKYCYAQPAPAPDYVFVWGNELDSEENIEYGEYIRILGAKYLRIGFWEGDGLTYNAFIQLPYALMDDSFYISENDL